MKLTTFEEKKWIETLYSNPNKFKTAPLEIRDNKRIIQAILSRPINVYFKFSISGELVNLNFNSLSFFEHASQRIRNDCAFVKQMMRKCSGYLFRHIGDELLSDEALFVFAAKHASFNALEKMIKSYNEKFPSDLTLNEVLNADVFQFKSTIKSQSILPKNKKQRLACHFLNNPKIILRVINSMPSVYNDISPILKRNPLLIKAAIRSDFTIFEKIPTEFQNDIGILMTYLKSEASLHIYDSRDFEVPLFWNKISETIKKSPAIYIRMIKEVKTMNFKPFIMNNSTPEILRNEIISSYLQSEIKLSFR